MMGVRLTLRPGQLGTKGPLARYGKRLVCVRYRYDEQTRQRVKTVELIENSTNWGAGDTSRDCEGMTAVRVDWKDLELGRKVKAAGGKWEPAKRVGALSREQVRRLGLEERVVEGTPIDVDIYGWISRSRWLASHLDLDGRI